ASAVRRALAGRAQPRRGAARLLGPSRAIHPAGPRRLLRQPRALRSGREAAQRRRPPARLLELRYFAVMWPSSSIATSMVLPPRTALAVQRYLVTGTFLTSLTSLKPSPWIFCLTCSSVSWPT